jgi:hypothetical protein
MRAKEILSAAFLGGGGFLILLGVVAAGDDLLRAHSSFPAPESGLGVPAGIGVAFFGFLSVQVGRGIDRPRARR